MMRCIRKGLPISNLTIKECLHENKVWFIFDERCTILVAAAVIGRLSVVESDPSAVAASVTQSSPTSALANRAMAVAAIAEMAPHRCLLTLHAHLGAFLQFAVHLCAQRLARPLVLGNFKKNSVSVCNEEVAFGTDHTVDCHSLIHVVLQRVLRIVKAQIASDILVFVHVSSGREARLEDDGSF